jgi:hypothetical protein
MLGKGLVEAVVPGGIEGASHAERQAR